MSNSSILGGERAAPRAIGRDVDALGPSDSSDSGSDVQGERTMPTDADNPGELGALPVNRDSDSDASGTGERGSATGDGRDDAADILPDHLVANPTWDTNAAGRPFASDDVEGIADDAEEDEDETAEDDARRH
ncbi:hypothetical protein [Rhizobacter sp. Root16D2]|uniref:hypothetical protein n=1 Tax=Rhizobacter sp. Root16D2 TaxID=1736479 RepID=UPI0006F3C498|nr:hypothetical protein [Rhizobacter sp. Root16D2]KRB06449.1 hypothetical protein ASE08_12440 [Rhizobacter sp. Root16D2]